MRTGAGSIGETSNLGRVSRQRRQYLKRSILASTVLLITLALLFFRVRVRLLQSLAMRFFHTLLAAGIVPSSLARSVSTRQTNVGAWAAQEEAIARAALFRNIGNKGEFAQDADAGAVIASPSTAAPD